MTDAERAGETPELALNRLLAGGGRGTVSTAESCTGGGVAARLTSVAGSSDYVLGGIVAYANAAKTGLLGVEPETIATRGAVSEECALQMAAGARRALGADWGVSTTGIAGPGGATPTKPVGLVWIAVAGPDGEEAARHVFPGDRAAVTAAATEEALRMLLRRVEAVAQPSR